MTLAELQDAVFSECGYPTDPGSTVTTRVRRHLNEAIRAVVVEPDMDRLLDSDVPYSFTSTVDQARYAIPNIVSIRHVFETTNDWLLTEMPLSDYRRADPDPAAHTGTPSHYSPIGRVALARSIVTPAALSVKSTSPSDVGQAYIEGTVTGGYTRTAACRMQGVVQTTCDTSITTWEDVHDFYLSQPAVGTVTLHEGTGVFASGPEKARITIGQTRQTYTGVYLWPTPSAAIPYYVDYRREVTDLVQPADEPPFRAACHPMIAAYARMREWETKGDIERAAVAKSQWDRWMSRLKVSIRSAPDDLPIVGRGRRVGHSRLGAWTPADYYTWG